MGTINPPLGAEGATKKIFFGYKTPFLGGFWGIFMPFDESSSMKIPHICTKETHFHIGGYLYFPCFGGFWGNFRQVSQPVR